MPQNYMTYTGHVDWVLLGSCNEPGTFSMIDLRESSNQPPVLAGFESASALPDNLSDDELAAAPENHRFKSACGEMLCVNGWCFVRPTDKTEADFPYHSLAITKRMLCSGGIFVGPRHHQANAMLWRHLRRTPRRHEAAALEVDEARDHGAVIVAAGDARPLEEGGKGVHDVGDGHAGGWEVGGDDVVGWHGCT